MVFRDGNPSNALQGWAVRELQTDKGGCVQRAHVSEIEVLVNGSGSSIDLQVLLNPLRGQDQASLFESRHRLVVVGGSFLQTEFLGEEEKCFVFLGVVKTGNGERPADRSPKILAAIERGLAPNFLPDRLSWYGWGRAYKIEVVTRVKRFVTDEFVEVAVQPGGPGLGGYLHRPGGRPPELSTVIGGQHLHFLNRIQAGVDHERA